MKKLTALLLALVMVLAMNVTVLAEGSTETITDGVATDLTDGLSAVKFDVKFDAADGVTIPAKTFKYDVSATDDLADDTSKPQIYKGVGTLTIEDVTFAASGDEKKEATIDLSQAGPFEKAGVYRYKVTQQEFTDEEVEAGFLNEKGTGEAVGKYLDLYVDNNGKILNAVMFESIQALNADGNDITYTQKTSEFTNTYGEGSGPDTTNKNEKTHTFTLDKKVTGGMGNQSDVFEFSFKAEYAGATTGLLNGVTYTIAQSSDGHTTTSTPAIGDLVTLNLTHDESVVITVPDNVLVTVTESRYATDEGYTIVAAQTGADDTTVSPVLTKNSGNINTPDAGSKIVVNDADATMTYTNARDAISPTGVVLRIAPYAIMLGAGVVLFIILKSRKNKAVEEA